MFCCVNPAVHSINKACQQKLCQMNLVFKTNFINMHVKDSCTSKRLTFKTLLNNECVLAAYLQVTLGGVIKSIWCRLTSLQDFLLSTDESVGRPSSTCDQPRLPCAWCVTLPLSPYLPLDTRGISRRICSWGHSIVKSVGISRVNGTT